MCSCLRCLVVPAVIVHSLQSVSAAIKLVSEAVSVDKEMIWLLWEVLFLCTEIHKCDWIILKWQKPHRQTLVRVGSDCLQLEFWLSLSEKCFTWL